MKKVVLSVIAGVVLFFIVFFFIGIYLTSNLVNEQVEKLVTKAKEIPSKEFYYSKIDSLPAPVQKYFRFALSEGITEPNFVRLKQSGKFKTNINADFKDITAEQYAITNQPGFIWSGDIHLASILWIKGIDTYFNGRGDLLIKFMSGVTITKETGKEIAQAQIVRWLLEGLWYPNSLLPSENLKWKAIDSTSAILHFTENDVEVEAVFHFKDDGSVSKVTSQRYMTTTAGPALTSFTGYFSDYRELNGIKIPFHSEVEWNLDHQDFKYGIFNIDKIEYDVFERFEE